MCVVHALNSRAEIVRLLRLRAFVYGSPVSDVVK